MIRSVVLCLLFHFIYMPIIVGVRLISLLKGGICLFTLIILVLKWNQRAEKMLNIFRVKCLELEQVLIRGVGSTKLNLKASGVERVEGTLILDYSNDQGLDVYNFLIKLL